MQADIENLHQEKEKISAQHQQIDNELEALQIQTHQLQAEIAKLGIDEERAQVALSEARNEQERIACFMEFLKALQKTIIESDTLFADKRDIFREKIAELKNDKNTNFATLYSFLMEHEALQDLQSDKLESMAEKADFFCYDTWALLDELFKPVSIQFLETVQALELSGFNLSVAECLAAVKKYVQQCLHRYGLAFNSKGILTAPLNQSSLANLPERLQARIRQAIRTQHSPEPYKLATDKPRFALETANAANFAASLPGLDLTYQDIIHCFVPALQMVAANQLHIDADTILPGVQVSMHAQDRIFVHNAHCIDTSGQAAPEFHSPKARDGDDPLYLQMTRNRPSGRDGDYGLCGFAGQNAGGIFVHAEKTIIGAAKLTCEAHGGMGAAGQYGGNGGQGADGQNTPDARSDNPPGGKWWAFGHKGMTLALARTPAVGVNQRLIRDEISGDGGLGGKAGWGGEGGFAATIIVSWAGQQVMLSINDADVTTMGESAADDLPIVSATRGQAGAHATPTATGGKAGRAGYCGLARYNVRKWKRSGAFGWFGRYKSYPSRPGNFSVSDFRRKMRGRFTVQHFGAGYSIQYRVSRAYCYPKELNRQRYISTDERSKGRDNSDILATMRTQSDRKQAMPQVDSIATLAHRHALFEASKNANRLTVLRRVTLTTQQKLTALARKIQTREAELAELGNRTAQTHQQKATTAESAQIKAQKKAGLEQNLTAINDSIAAAESNAQQTIHQLIATYADLRELEAAAVAAHAAKVDWQTEQTLEQKLAVIYKRLQVRLNEEETQARTEYAEHNAAAEALLDKLDQLAQKRDQLVEEQRALQARKQTLQLELAKLDQIHILNNISAENPMAQVHQQVHVDPGVQPTSTEEMPEKPLGTNEATSQSIPIGYSLTEAIAELRQLANSATVDWHTLLQHQIEWLQQMPNLALFKFTGYVSASYYVMQDIETQNSQFINKMAAWLFAIQRCGLAVLEAQRIASKNSKITHDILQQYYHGIFYSKTANLIPIIEQMRFCEHVFITLDNSLAGRKNRKAASDPLMQLFSLPSAYAYEEKNKAEFEAHFDKIAELLAVNFPAETSLDDKWLTLIQKLRKRDSRRKKLLANAKNTESDPSEYMHVLTEIITDDNQDYLTNLHNFLRERIDTLIEFNEPHIMSQFYQRITAEYTGLLSLQFELTLINTKLSASEQAEQLWNQYQEACTIPEIKIIETMRMAITTTDISYDFVIKFINIVQQSTVSDVDKHLLQKLFADVIDVFQLDDQNEMVTTALSFIEQVRPNNIAHAIQCLRDGVHAQVDALRRKLQTRLLEATHGNDLRAHFTIIEHILTDGYFGLTNTQQLQQLKAIYLSIENFEISQSLENLSDDFVVIAQNAHQFSQHYLYQILHEQAENDADPDKKAAIMLNAICTSDAQWSTTQLNTVLSQYLFMLSMSHYQPDDNIDMHALATQSLRLKNNLLLMTNPEQLQLWIRFNQQIDRYIESNLINRIHKEIYARQQTLQQQSKKRATAAAYLPQFHGFFPDTLPPAVVKQKQRFVTVLLQRLMNANIDDIESIDTISELITQQNRVSFSKVQKRGLFNGLNAAEIDPTLVEPLNTLNRWCSATDSADHVNEIFIAWQDIMRFCLDRLDGNYTQDKNITAVSHFIETIIQHSTTFLQWIIFSDADQQDILYSWAQELIALLPRLHLNGDTELDYILQIETLKDQLLAAAYEPTFCYHVAQFERADVVEDMHYRKKHVLSQLEQVGLPQLSAALQQMRLRRDDAITQPEFAENHFGETFWESFDNNPENTFTTLMATLNTEIANTTEISYTNIQQRLTDLQERLGTTELDELHQQWSFLSQLYGMIRDIQLTADELASLSVQLLDLYKKGNAGIQNELNALFALLCRHYQQQLKTLTKSEKIIIPFQDLRKLAEIQPRLAVLVYQAITRVYLSETQTEKIDINAILIAANIDVNFESALETALATCLEEESEITDTNLALLLTLLPFIEEDIITPLTNKYVDNFENFSLKQKRTLLHTQFYSLRNYVNNRIVDDTLQQYLHQYILRLLTSSYTTDQAHLLACLNEVIQLTQFIDNRLSQIDYHADRFIADYANQHSDNTLLHQFIWPESARHFAKRISHAEQTRLFNEHSPLEWEHELQQQYWQQVIQNEIYLVLFNAIKEMSDITLDSTQENSIIELLKVTQIAETVRLQDDVRDAFREEKPAWLEKFLNVITAHKRQLIHGQSIANTRHHLYEWLAIIDILREDTRCLITAATDQTDPMLLLAALQKMTSLLEWSYYFPTHREFHTCLSEANPQNRQHHIVCRVLEYALMRQIIPKKGEQINNTMLFRAKKFNTPLGIQFIGHFAKRIYQGLGSARPSLSITWFNELMTLLHDSKAYDDVALVADLDTRALQYWLPTLRRRKIATRLHLDCRDERVNRLVEDLLDLQKINPALAARWLTRLSEIDALDTKIDVLLNILPKFTLHHWPLDLYSTQIIEENAVDTWFTLLTTAVAEKTEADGQRDIKKLVEQATILNPTPPGTLASLLNPIAGEPTLLEWLVEESFKNYTDTYKNADKADIADWIANHSQHDQNTESFNTDNDDFLTDYLAILIRAVELSEGKILYKTQLITLIGFIRNFNDPKGLIAGLNTGGGKSLVALLLAITAVLRGEIVDIITSSKALAIPQAKAAESLCELLNINVCCICDLQCEKEEDELMRRYRNNQIFYGDIGSFQAHYLATQYQERAIRPRNSNRVIIDEADTLIDRSNHVLYFSHTIHDLENLQSIFEFIWQCVHAKGSEYATQKSIKMIIALYQKSRLEETLSVPVNLIEFVDENISDWINSAYRAKETKIDGHYSIFDRGDYANRIIINELSTGVEQLNSQWGKGYQQFLQLKHMKRITPLSLRALFISNVAYLERYKQSGRINGMTGTLGGTAEANVMRELYGVENFQIPRLFPNKFRLNEAVVVGDNRRWMSALLEDITQLTITSTPLTEEIKSHAREEIAKARTEIANCDTVLTELQENINNTIITYQQQAQLCDRLRQELNFKPTGNDQNDTKKREALAKEYNTEKLILAGHQDRITEYQQQQATQREKRSAYTAKIVDLEPTEQGNSARATLIICEDKDRVASIVHALQNHATIGPEIEAKKVRVVTYDSFLTPLEERLNKVQPGDIIVATNIAGRGTHLSLGTQLIENGGLHVALTYMPSNKRIEEQAFGRAARINQPGTGRFYVCDSRAKSNTNEAIFIAIGQLQDERDAREQQRLGRILSIQKPKLQAEQALAEKFHLLQKDITTQLKAKNTLPALIDFQIKSLQDHWAFWFHKLGNKVNNVYKTGDAVLFDEFSAFRLQMLALFDADQERLVTEPGELIRLGRYYMGESDAPAAHRCFDKIIAKDSDFAGFAYYYKAHLTIAAGKKEISLICYQKHIKT